MNMIEFLTEVDSFREQLSQQAQEFLDELKDKNSGESLLTEAGKKILITMNTNMGVYLNTFSSKQLGELLFMPARSVSGAMRKLVTEQYVKKSGTNPVTYNLTQAGIEMAKELKVDND